MLGNLACVLVSVGSPLPTLKKKKSAKISRVSNSLDPDQALHLDILGPDCLQRLSPDDKIITLLAGKELTKLI